MSDCIPASFVRPDLDVFCGLDSLGLKVEGMRHDPPPADGRPATITLACRAQTSPADALCHICGVHASVRDTRTRTFTHLPYGERPTILSVRYRRYRCGTCTRVWSQDLRRISPPKTRITHRAAAWAARALARSKLSVAAISRALGVCWHATWNAIKHVAAPLLTNPARLEGIRAIGIDEHAWRHKPGTDPYVTVIVDLTPTLEHTGPARLLAMVDGHAADAVEAWLSDLPNPARQSIEAIAMDGLAAYKKAAKAKAEYAAVVLDPFHVVRWAGDKVSAIRKRLTIEIFGRRGRAGEGLYDARRILLTRRPWLTPAKRSKLAALFNNPRHTPLHQAWMVYQRIREAYEQADPMVGRMLMAHLIDSIKPGTGHKPPEIASLGRTMDQRRADILAVFDHHHVTCGPVEAINGRIEHPRDIALGFRNRTNHETRTLTHSRQTNHPHHQTRRAGMLAVSANGSSLRHEGPFFVQD